MKEIRTTDGHHLVIQHNAEPVRIVGGVPGRITLNHCGGTELHGADGQLFVAGSGNDQQLPLIALLNSPDVYISYPSLQSRVDDSDKQSWRRSVCNGIAICPNSSGAYIDRPSLEYVHMGILNRAAGLTVAGGSIAYWSGDAIHSAEDASKVSDFKGRYSLEVWEYDELHRDFMQFYQGNKSKIEQLPVEGGSQTKTFRVLSGVHVEDCELYAPNHGHKWAKSCDGLMGTDHVYRDVSLLNNQIFTDNHNGILFNPILGYRFEGNITKGTKYYERSDR